MLPDELTAYRTKQLERLDASALELLGVLVLENMSMTRGKLRHRAHERGVRGPQVEPSGDKILAGIIEQLAAGGLVVPDDKRLLVPGSVVLPTLAVLHARQRLGTLAKPERARMHDPRRYSYSGHELTSELRIAVAEDDAAALERGLAVATRLISQRDLAHWFIQTFGQSPSAALVRKFPEHPREVYLHELLVRAGAELTPLSDDLLDAALELGDKALRLEVGRLLVLRGRAERALELDKLPKYGVEGLELLAAFWAGDYAEAARIGGEAVAAMRARKRKSLPDLEGICHVLAGLANAGSDPQSLKEIDSLVDANLNNRTWDRHSDTYVKLGRIHASLMGEIQHLAAQSHNVSDFRPNWLANFIAALHDVWLDVRPKSPAVFAHVLEQLRDWAKRAWEAGYEPVARELEGTVTALAAAERRVEDNAPAPTLASMFRAPASWESALIGLDAIISKSSDASGNAKSEQELIWELRARVGHGELTPRHRTSSRARKGKAISLARLLKGQEDYLDTHDQRVVAAAEPDDYDSDYGRGRRGGMMLGPRALVALIGHPRVFDEDGNPLRVVRGQPRLLTERGEQGVRVKLVPAQLAELAVYCHRMQDTVRIYERTDELARIAQILDAGLVVPECGLERLNATLARLCVAEGLAVEGDVTPEAEQIVADARPSLLLGWDGETLTVRACVAPLGLAGPQLRPGVGNRAITAELHERGQLRLLRCERELAEERRRLDELEHACPTLLSYAVSTLEWRVTVLADALEVMLELGRFGDEVVLAWPKGRSLQPPSVRELKHLKLAVSGQRDWLGVEVSVDLDEGEILSFRQLIASRTGARFVKLDDDRFVALSEQLRRRLDALESFSANKRDGLRATPALLPLLDELSADLDDATFDKKALAKLQRIRELASAEPRLPRGFGTTLRAYQKDGYTWMWRLAEAGLGACLADDMGLGKTVQTLALLSQRASKGPALVVCPTSVVGNWVNETTRFAPSLRPTILAQSRDRAATLAGLGRRDLLVCSYGILASESEALAEIQFATAVFDEAHALKNQSTNRAKAARAIQAEFRLGLTGTPVENRVDELWSLFRVLTPGLLGGKSEFDDRFAKPIARGDRDRTTQLRTLLRPFILRRTKSQVLDELPARTEITLSVEPGAKQRAYYEALRRRAVEAVDKGDPRKKRFRILAEITRLRQAAVDPRLLDPSAAPAGAKIDALVEQVLALREEGHRALIFTQFLGSMALIRERLDAAGVEYLELDGSTPAAERSRRVDAFQSGEGDVFVLSLRAGGVGMNLTGADYVLHLDPWWNPAVEDQATDRAHRIGQTRPVTVYRLITEGSIEEKILALHQSKRELADDILAGLEGTEALGVEELLGLL